jgi:hypothetical protein
MSARELVEEAARLADRLGADGGVKRNVLQALVAAFQAHRDVARLRRMLALLGAGEGGHLLRGRGYREQIERAIPRLVAVLDRPPVAAAQLPTLFAWTTRFLPSEQEGGGRSGAGRESKDPEPPTSPRPARTYSSAGGGLGALAAELQRTGLVPSEPKTRKDR